ncbi:MAG TPA: glycosyltransferase family 1 protein [Acidimicrobiia bacterium]|nr:glycosyltransferase family 1 protein [Acidimicrobiia bacterium]
MRVGLNAEPLFQRVPTGVGVYALALCRGLVEIGHADDLVFFHADHDDVETEMNELPVDRVAFTLSRDRLYEAWMADRRPAPQSIAGHLDVVHSTGPAIPPPGGAALVITVHDLAPIRFADRYPRRARALHKRGAHIAAAEAARIICPSRSTALDVEEFYGVDRDRIRVVPHGVDVAGLSAADHTADADAARRWERRGITEPYVLWVGTQEQRKNVVAVLDAFSHLAGRHPELNLVLHGPNGWLGDEVGEGLQHRGLHGRTIVSEGSLPRSELAALYARASVFVYPSLYEGFGMPVLEAMACGTPVVTSNISALPETAGDAALLVDPLDDLALAEAITRILEDPGLAGDLASRGRKRARSLTWGETARRTWAVYEEARAVAGS